MKIKRYIAKDTQEAMLKVRSELGVNAIILHSRKIKKSGLFGIFQKPLIEVVAAIEENEQNFNHQAKTKSSIKEIYQQVENDKMTDLQNQLENIHELLITFINKEPKTNKMDESTLYEKYLNLLVNNDIDKNVATKIMNIVQRQISFSNKNEEAIKKALKIIIKEYLTPVDTIRSNEKCQKRIVFVGPTGVGKTTTLAKLAAKLSLVGSKSIGIITSDTYRIAAVEQLRTYSEILDVPLKVIYEPEEVSATLEDYKDKDIVLIDTAGRNHRLEQQLEEIKKLIEHIPNPEVFLVVSATTSYKDIINIVHSYSFIEDYKLLFTKIDESSTLGNILNTKVLSGKNLSYIATGQSVPDDIEIANPDKIANIIVGE